MRTLHSYDDPVPYRGCGDGIQGLGSRVVLTGVSTLSIPYVPPHRDLYGQHILFKLSKLMNK